MKMDASLERKIHVTEELVKWTAGGAGYSGTARTASACVTNKDPSLTDISIYERLRQTLITTCEYFIYAYLTSIEVS
jgi:hypothetical protein